MRNILLILGVVLMLSPAQLSSAKISNENGISIEGKSRILTKPDIAHCFLKIDGFGKTFEESDSKSQEKVKELKTILKAVLGATPEISIFKTTNHPRSKSYEDMYQDSLIMGVAKAMKGEEVKESGKEEEKPMEMETSNHIFFSFENFTKEKILELRSKLVEKEIAFDEQNPFSFSMEYLDPNQSGIVFGLKNYEVHLESLARKAFERAQKNAATIAKATGKKLGKLIGITGCGGGLEGTVNFAGEELVGKELGPLSADPEMLSVKFSKTFEFQIK